MRELNNFYFIGKSVFFFLRLYMMLWRIGENTSFTYNEGKHYLLICFFFK